MADDLNARLSGTTSLLGLRVWELIGICVGFFIFLILSVMTICLFARKNRRGRQPTDGDDDDEVTVIQIPAASKEIKVVRAADRFSNEQYSRSHSCESVEQGNNGRDSSSSSSLLGISHLGWGYWFTLRDLQLATDHFSKHNILGEGGYGVVYRGNLVNATPVAVKRLLNDTEFRVEVGAIGHVRHKNLVRLLGYCIEGTHRMLVYEYVDNGNLEQCLHASTQDHSFLTWDDRIKILLGTAKGISYLHEAIEPKVIHRDIKSSNILIDRDFNAKVSDFGLAKLLGSGTSHIATRVMGTFGYVAPEYANTGLLNEKSDVYSFGIVLLEAITGRNPVDYGRPAHEVNLVDWLKRMIANRRAEEVVDPTIAVRPPPKSLKMALLTALKCVDPDPEKRPSMSRAVQMLENQNYQIRFGPQ